MISVENQFEERASCKVVDYASRLPNDAKCVSLHIADSEVPVKNANDVLVWVCKKMTLHRTKQLQTCIKARKVSWIKTNGNGMGHPYQIAYNCFIDLDASGRTALLRASLILQWLSWPSDDAVIAFERPSSVAAKSVKDIRPINIHPTPMPATKPTVATGMDMTRSKGYAEPVINSAVKYEIKRFSYKYDNVESINDARPLTLLFKGKEFSLDGEWVKLPEKICVALETIWPCKLHDIVGRGKVPNMALNPIGLRKGKFVKGAGIWYETNCKSCDFIKQTRSLCRFFGVALEGVSIKFVKTSQQSPGQSGDSEKRPSQQTVVRSNIPARSYESQIAELLEAEFTNGVRPGSIIDCNKIRKLYRQHFGENLSEDFAFATVLPRVGIVHDGKVFPRPSSKGGGWRKLVERLVGQGHTVFQFSRLMELHASELMQIGIVSSEMLRETMMREAQDAYEVSGEFFAPKGVESVTKRLISIIIPQEGSIVDMIAVAKRVPYVDMTFIRNLCKGVDNLVRISQDSYAIVSRIEFDDAEVARGKSQCESAIKAEGFFSLSQLHLDDSAAMNDRGLVDSALRRAFFQRFLSERFDIHGQIVCAKGASMDGQIPLHAFLREHSDVSLEQLEAVAKEYNIAPWLALKTAHEEMVRVDRERFVAPEQIAFDVPSVDESISGVCEGRIMPFGAFANLSDFPAVPGFAWNEFLLEAFLRRASKGFRLVSPSAPARDVSGAVVPRFNGEWRAEDAFATIALRCGVAAEAEEVGDFLVATQCVLRRSTKTVGAVVSRMKELEKR